MLKDTEEIFPERCEVIDLITGEQLFCAKQCQAREMKDINPYSIWVDVKLTNCREYCTHDTSRLVLIKCTVRGKKIKSIGTFKDRDLQGWRHASWKHYAFEEVDNLTLLKKLGGLT